MEISIGADHGGYEIKQKLKEWLFSRSIEVNDFGTDTTASVNYPGFAHVVAMSIQNYESDFGILVCGSGQGMAITANKHRQIRAALCWNKSIAKLSREHNNANILVLPGRFLSGDEAIEIVEVFLKTEFAGGRHQSRIDLIDMCR